MKKLLVLVVMLITIQETSACDQCSVIVGSGVISEGHFIGYRLKYRRQFLTTGQENGKSLSKHLDHFKAEGNIKELYTSHELFGNLHLGKDWHLMFALPFVNNYRGVNDSEVKDIYGLGDPWLLLRRQWMKKSENDLFFITGGLGVKLPVGRTDLVENDETVDLDMQPGSGSMDFLSNLVLLYEYKSWMLINQNTAKWNGISPGEYRYGNTLSSGLSLGRKLLAKVSSDWKINLTGGAYAEWIGKDEKDAKRQGDLSSTFYIDTGLNLRFKNMVATFNAQIPWFNDLDSRQLPTTHRFVMNLQYEI